MVQALHSVGIPMVQGRTSRPHSASAVSAFWASQVSVVTPEERPGLYVCWQCRGAGSSIRGLLLVRRGAWVSGLEKATQTLGSGDTPGGSGSSVRDTLRAIQASASSGSLGETKAKYVQLVTALKDWTTQVGITGGLTGL